MPRVRTKRAASVALPAAEQVEMTGPMGVPGERQVLDVKKPEVRLIPIFHARMKVIRTEADIKAALKEGLPGAFVKVMPTVRASQRSSVDSKALRDTFMNAGAVAVVVAPVIVPDGTREKASEAPRAVATAESHLRAWFAGVKAEKGVVEAALYEALKTAGEAGL